MNAPDLSFAVLPGAFSVVRLGVHETVAPLWAMPNDQFWSITRTGDEMSVICPTPQIPTGHRAEHGWALFKLLGPFAFDTIGVLASCAQPLAAAGVSIFALSTFDTDYILVKQAQLALAVSALTQAGHRQA